MEYLRIKNLRSLGDTHNIDLKPITILVGENSSGKSTFLRVFPLFKQTIEARTAGSLLWYGELVDFGDFSDALCKIGDHKTIEFEFGFLLSPRPAYVVGRPFIGRLPVNITITLKYAQDMERETTRASECCIEFFDDKILLASNVNNDHVTKFMVNGIEFPHDELKFSSSFRQELIPNLAYYDRQTQTYISRTKIVSEVLQERLLSTFRSILGSEFNFDNQMGVSTNPLLAIGTPEQMLERIKKFEDPNRLWHGYTSEWTVNTDAFKDLRNLLVANTTNDLIDSCNTFLTTLAEQTSYVAPLRATAERYYRRQSLAINQIDAQGQNLAMYFRSLSNLRREKFSRWTREHFGFSLQTTSTTGHVSLEIRENGTERAYNLADMGFGFSQLLPVITQLWLLSESRVRNRPTTTPMIYVIEQPELHLHPRLQAKLADTFVATIDIAEASNLPIKLIIETHSETIINRLGLRVAYKHVKADAINIVVFEKDEPNSYTKVTTSQYGEDGILRNWPYGFFEPERA